MNTTELNTFIREYLDARKLNKQGAIVFDPRTTEEHNRLVCEVCLWLKRNNLIYYTRVYTKLGEIVDIVVPELPRPFIEVRVSEEEKKKEYCPEYNDLRIFVDASDPFKLW